MHFALHSLPSTNLARTKFDALKRRLIGTERLMIQKRLMVWMVQEGMMVQEHDFLDLLVTFGVADQVEAEYMSYWRVKP